MKIGEKLKALRKEKELTLDQLAELTGVAKATLSRIENGMVGGNMSTLRKIALALHVSVDELISEEIGVIYVSKEDVSFVVTTIKNDLKVITEKLCELCDKLHIKIEK